MIFVGAAAASMTVALVSPAPTAPGIAARIISRCAPCVAQSEGPDPEEWRSFRAKLISGGLKLTEDADSASATTEEKDAAEPTRESVAPANEALLKAQNEALFEEYLGGAWAHAAPEPEVGGLLCRMPLQAQLMHLMRTGGGNTWGEKLRERLEKGIPGADDPEERERLLKQWSSNTVYMYRLAEGMIGEGLQEIANKASGGKVSMSMVSEDQRELITLYSDAQDSWQEVALVLNLGEQATGEEGQQRRAASEALVINRPIARSMSTQLAQLLLNGAEEGRRGLPPLHDEPFVQRFMAAFGNEAAVYVGGPESQDALGIVIHGFDLPGASELAPGTKIYTGGVEAIVDAVLDGSRSPLDFRWFVGRRRDVSTIDGAWGPVACARPVALKQCLGLPKPLWHEVLELCGGEMGELSRIELLKRDDLEAK